MFEIESPLIHDDENLLLTYGNDYANSHAKKLDKVAMDTFLMDIPLKMQPLKIFNISIGKDLNVDYCQRRLSLEQIRQNINK